jgi:hypothetical protein
MDETRIGNETQHFGILALQSISVLFKNLHLQRNFVKLQKCVIFDFFDPFPTLGMKKYTKKAIFLFLSLVRDMHCVCFVKNLPFPNKTE